MQEVDILWVDLTLQFVVLKELLSNIPLHLDKGV